MKRYEVEQKLKTILEKMREYNQANLKIRATARAYDDALTERVEESKSYSSYGFYAIGIPKLDFIYFQLEYGGASRKSEPSEEVFRQWLQEKENGTLDETIII